MQRIPPALHHPARAVGKGERSRETQSSTPWQPVPVRDRRICGARSGRGTQSRTPWQPVPVQGRRICGARSGRTQSRTPWQLVSVQGRRICGERSRETQSSTPWQPVPVRDRRICGARSGRGTQSRTPWQPVPVQGRRICGARSGGPEAERWAVMRAKEPAVSSRACRAGKRAAEIRRSTLSRGQTAAGPHRTVSRMTSFGSSMVLTWRRVGSMMLP